MKKLLAIVVTLILGTSPLVRADGTFVTTNTTGATQSLTASNYNTNAGYVDTSGDASISTNHGNSTLNTNQAPTLNFVGTGVTITQTGGTFSTTGNLTSPNQLNVNLGSLQTAQANSILNMGGSGTYSSYIGSPLATAINNLQAAENNNNLTLIGTSGSGASNFSTLHVQGASGTSIPVGATSGGVATLDLSGLNTTQGNTNATNITAANTSITAIQNMTGSSVLNTTVNGKQASITLQNNGTPVSFPSGFNTVNVTGATGSGVLVSGSGTTATLSLQNLNTTQGNTNATNITAETTRATAAEGVLTTNLNTTNSNLTTETNARIAGDTANTTTINGVQTQVTNNLNAQNTINTAQVATNTTLANGETTLTNNLATTNSNLSAETAARVAGDNANTTAINNEVTARTAAVAGVQTQVTNNLNAQTTVNTAQTATNSSVQGQIVTINSNAFDTNNPTSLQTQINTLGNSSSNGLAAETAARIAGDSANTTAITNETTRATTSEGALQTQITNNASTEVNDIANVNQSITNETTRATTAENTLTTNLGTEVTRATNAEGILQTNINTNDATEVSDVSSINNMSNPNTVLNQTISNLQGNNVNNAAAITAINNMTDPSTVLNQTVNANTANISAETTRATGAETTLQTNVSNETSRATTAEGTLQTNITNETVRATSVESGIQNMTDGSILSNTVNTHTQQISVLNTGLSNEATVRAAADTQLQSNIDNETTRAAGAENTLQNNINSEATTRSSADQALQNQINNLNTQAQANTDSINKLEETKYLLEPTVRLYDSKRWQVQAFDSYDVRHSLNSAIGMRVMFKIGPSYEEKLMTRTNPEIARLLAVNVTNDIAERDAVRKQLAEDRALISDQARLLAELQNKLIVSAGKVASTEPTVAARVEDSKNVPANDDLLKALDVQDGAAFTQGR